MFEIMKELHVSKSKFRKFSISKFVKFKFQCKISSFAVMWEKILSMHSMQNILSEDKLWMLSPIAHSLVGLTQPEITMTAAPKWENIW